MRTAPVVDIEGFEDREGVNIAPGGLEALDREPDEGDGI